MPSQFDQQFAQSATPGLFAEFGESIVYRLAGGGLRSISAIIDRNPPAIYGPNSEVILPSFILRLKADPRRGVRASEVNSGGDEVDLIAKVGDQVFTRKTVLQLVSSDSGVTVVALK